jgi:tetratricopeptide (TPR) repeat protein
LFVPFLALAVAGCSWIFPEKALMKKAREAEAQGKYADAVATYEEVVRRFPKKEEAEDALSRAALLYEERLNNWQKAAAYLQELKSKTQGKPEHPQILLRLARILEHSGSPYADALENYGLICRNCASAPESMSAYLAQGRIYETMQDWRNARSIYEEALSRSSPGGEGAVIASRLENLQLVEALGAYSGGRIEDAVKMAREALARNPTVPEVRRGLEDLVSRWQMARHFWATNPALTVARDIEKVAVDDPVRYSWRARKGGGGTAPEGWELSIDAKTGVLSVAQKLPAPEDGGKKKSVKKKPWTFKSPSRYKALAAWWSRDGTWLAWISREATGRKRIDSLDLVKRRNWAVTREATKGIFGEVLLFLPGGERSGTLIYASGSYIAVSNVRGGDMVMIRIGEKKTPFNGPGTQLLASSSDGIELMLSCLPPAKPAGKKAKAPVEEPKPEYWKVNLSAGGEF